jgi:hypothetical protein
MKYMLLIYGNAAEADAEMQKFTEEEQQAAMREWFTFADEANAAGVLLDYNGFAPVTASTTVRMRDDKALITDGPFAETHEQLAGFYLMDCKDLDDAIRWAKKIPAAKKGSIEIRPLWNSSGEQHE